MDNIDFKDNKNNSEVSFEKRFRSKSRTYFFDAREIKDSKNYYLTITESKRIFDEDPTKKRYEKHKIFLYKESFDEFKQCLEEMIEHLKKISEKEEDN